MPASVNEAISASLHMSLWHSKTANLENGESMLQQRMASVSKMLPDISYETSSDTYYSSVLQNLKNKYTGDGTPSTLNGNGCPDGVRDNVLPTPVKILYPIDKVQMGWLEDKNCRVGSGFSNAGNTCYLNSVLQALFHIPPLYNWLLYGDQEHQKNCSTFRNCSQECIVCCMAMTLRSSQNGSGEIRPGFILSKLRFICKRLIPGQQEDAMEFLRYLFEAMEKSFLQRFGGQKIDNRSKETTPLNQIFGGYIRTEVTCMSCHAVSTTFQHFLDLTLDITRAFSLDNALEYYFAQERLEENSYRCEKCKKKVPATKQFFVERPPNVLCIQLKRFSIEGKKIGKNIKLNERINLNKYKSRVNGAHQKGANYRLVAGVNHLGHSAQSGHYTTLAYAPNSSLYLFDDGCVQQAWQRSFSGSDVYLLMYVLEPKKQFDGSAKAPCTAVNPQNKDLVRRLPGMSPKPSTSSAPSFGLNSPKPGIIFTQNRKFLPSTVTGYSGTLNGKVATSPVKKVVNVSSLNKVEFASNGCTSKSEGSQPEKVVTSPQKPSIKFIGPSMPSLVPYQDDHSSDDEELKIAKKTEVKCPQTGSSSSNELPKPANRPSESPKKPQLNLNQSNNAVSKEEPVVQKTESNDGSQSSTKSDFSVKSTSATWNVSSADKTPPSQTTKLTSNSNWVVTVASKNKMKPEENGQPREKENLKRKHDSSDNIEMEWIEKPNHKPHVNGVTNYKNSVSSTTAFNGVKKQDQYGPQLPDNVAATLLKSSHKGYGGADVKSWAGTKSTIDKQVYEEFWMNKRDKDNSCDYDDEMDGGKSKKMKSNHEPAENGRGNLFQQEADRRRSDDRTRDYNRDRDHDRRRDYRPYNNHRDEYRPFDKHRHHKQDYNRFDRRDDQRNGHHRDRQFRPHYNKFQNQGGYRQKQWSHRY